MQSECSQQAIHFGTFRFEPADRRLFEGDKEIALNPRALELLGYLIRHPQRIISKEEIHQAVWNGVPVTDDAVVQRILDIRKALRDNPREPEFVRTHSRRGYEWIGTGTTSAVPAEVAAEAAPAAAVAEPAPTSSPSRKLWWAAGAGAVLLAAIAAVIWLPARKVGDATPLVPELRMVRLTSLPGMEDYPAYEPHGSRIVYASDEGGEGNLWILDRDANAEQLTRDGKNDSEPDWSPDGKWIAFRSDRDQGGIYLLSLETKAITLAVPFGHHPRWSPDGSRLLLHTEGNDGRIHVWTKATGKTTELSIASPAVTNRAFPVWSPDGREVFFLGMAPRAVSPAGSVVLGHQIWRVPAVGGEAQLVTRGFGTVRDGGFDLSPTGRDLVFTGLDRSLWKLSLTANSKPVRLTLTTEEHQHPRYGFNGEIAFATVASPDSLWLLPFGEDGRPDEKRLKRLTRAGVLARDPVVSPDNQTIAYVTWAGERFEVWCLDMASHRTWRASPHSGPSRTRPLWSRDGQYLVYQFLDGANRSDVVARFDKSTRVVVSEQVVARETAVRNGAFDVSTDGKIVPVVAQSTGGASVFFDKADSGWFNLWQRRPGQTPTAVEQVTHFHGSPLLMSDANRAFAVHPNGLILSLRENRSDLWMLR